MSVAKEALDVNAVIDAGDPPVSASLAEPDDIALIRAYRNGDVEAFDQIFRRYHERIRSLCLRHLGDSYLAEDMVQETFFNVLRSIGRIDGSYNFSAWIHRIAINLCLDELRRKDRRQCTTPTGDLLGHPVVGLVERDQDPETAWEVAQLRGMLLQVASRLPERQRQALTLRELQGLSYASIGAAMGTSHAAVETLIHRARKRFREEYLALEASVPA
jgi:RNA polymerase sigma-70 factor, ECF subfamily